MQPKSTGMVYRMSKPKVLTRRGGVVAVAACGLVALSACSSSGSTGASSSSLTTTSSLPVVSTAPSTSSSASRSVLSASSSSGPPKSTGSAGATSSGPTASSSGKGGKSSASGKPTTSKPPVKADPVGACLTANKESNAAITQWNAAVSSQSKTKLDAAAKNFQTTATSLRKLPAKSQNKGFESRVKAVATDLDVMAKAQFDGKSVTTSTYNKDSETLRTYCQKLITNA